MLQAPKGSFLRSERPLQSGVVHDLKLLFRDQIIPLGIKHKDTTSTNSNWLYDQPNFDSHQMEAIDKLLALVGWRIARRYANINSLICYRDVNAHDDTSITVAPGVKMRVDDCSFLFLPLYGNDGAEFVIGEPGNKQKAPIQDGSIVLLDHNVEHEVRFPPGNKKLKFGLSFLVDRIIRGPHGVSIRPLDPQSPSTPEYLPLEPLYRIQALSDVGA